MRIKRAGVWHKVESKQLILLSLLIEHQGRAISRDELLDKVWPNVIVSDNSLSKLVAQLRKTIGDDRNDQSIVRTVPRVGYQLIAPAKKVEKTATSFIQQNLVQMGLGCIVLGGIFGLLLFYFNQPYSLANEYHARLLTQRGGVEQGVSFSHDGRYMVFNYNSVGKNNSDLAVMDLDQQISHVLKNANYSEQNGVFSPDQKWLAYIRNDALQCNIRVISTASAIETWRLSLDSKLAGCPSNLQKMGLSWPQAHILLAHFNNNVVRFTLNFDPFPRAVADAHVIVDNVDEWSVTPDHLFTLNKASNRVTKHDFDGNVLTALSHEEVGVEHIAVSNDSLWLVNDKLSLYRGNKRLGAMSISRGQIAEIAIHPKSGDIVVSKAQSNTGLFSVTPNQLTQLGSSIFPTLMPVLSPAGNKYAYVTLDQGSMRADVWVSHTNSDSVQFITSLAGAKLPEFMSFSPNGNFLLVGYLNSHLSLIDLTTKNSITIAKGVFDNVYWQAQGKGVFYVKTDANGDESWYFELSTGLAAPNAPSVDLDFMIANREYRDRMTQGFRSYAHHVAEYLAERIFDPLLIDNIVPTSDLFTPKVYQDGIYFMAKKGQTLMLFNYHFASQEYSEVANLSEYNVAQSHKLTITSSQNGEVVIVNLVDNLQSDLVRYTKLDSKK